MALGLVLVRSKRPRVGSSVKASSTTQWPRRGFLVAYPFYAMGGLKAGDGKYLMAVGAMRGVGLLLTGAV